MKLLTIGVLVLFVACAGTKAPTASTKLPLTSQNERWLIDLATQSVGDHPTIEANKDASFSLCWQDKMNTNQIPALQFIIVRMSDHKIVEQGSVTMGEVRWTNDYEVEVSPRQGQVQLARGPESNIRTINVKKYLDAIGR